MLIRAVEPLEGMAIVKQNRPIKSKKLRDLTGGPSKLTKALEIGLNFNGHDLRGESDLYITEGELDVPEILATKRINVDYAEVRHLFRQGSATFFSFCLVFSFPSLLPDP